MYDLAVLWDWFGFAVRWLHVNRFSNSSNPSVGVALFSPRVLGVNCNNSPREVCVGTTSSSCECRPGFEGDRCLGINQCAAPACARQEIVEAFAVHQPPSGWSITTLSNCSTLPPHLGMSPAMLQPWLFHPHTPTDQSTGGAGVLSNQTMSKTFAAIPAHQSLGIELQLVLIDDW